MLQEGIGGVLQSKSKLFLAFCFCFIVGASSFSFLQSRHLLFYLYIFSLVIIFAAIIFWNKKLPRFLLLCLLVFILGGVRFLITIPDNNSARIEFYNGQKKVVRGFVAKEPDRGLSDARYVVRVTELSGSPPVILSETKNPCPNCPVGQRSLEGVNPARDGKDGQWKDGRGNISIKTLIYPEYNYGDNLEIECFLQEPTNFEDSTFNYKKYLAKQDIWSICSAPKIKKLEGDSGNPLVKIMLRFKTKIEVNISRLWPQPDSSLMAGILYGSRSGLPQDLTDNFSRTGVSHIIAVSGYNVSIIIVALNGLLIYLGFFRKQSFWLLVFLIIAFVFFTGASASVVRAGVMALVTLIAQHAGRLSAIGRVLTYTCVIMLVSNPYMLVWDAGFQLSFLATVGLVYLSPIIKEFFDKKFTVKNTLLSGLLEVFVTTMAAIIITLPLIMYQFGRVSLVAPLVNMLILWSMPWLMLCGFLALVLSFIFFPIGQLVGWLTEFGIRYVIMVIDWFGRLAWAAIEIRIPLWVMVLSYALLLIFILKSYKKASELSLIK